MPEDPRSVPSQKTEIAGLFNCSEKVIVNALLISHSSASSSTLQFVGEDVAIAGGELVHFVAFQLKGRSQFENTFLMFWEGESYVRSILNEAQTFEKNKK